MRLLSNYLCLLQGPPAQRKSDLFLMGQGSATHIPDKSDISPLSVFVRYFDGEFRIMASQPIVVTVGGPAIVGKNQERN